MWHKHVLQSRDEERLTGELLKFLNENKLEPGSVIVREQERKGEAPGGFLTGLEPYSLTILYFKA